MRIAVFSALGLFLLLFLLLWLIRQIRYEITPRNLQVTLFGLCLRRLPLAQIETVSKRRSDGWAENWWNTTRPGHRALFIRRRRGLIRNFVITPRNRYMFRAELLRAVEEEREAARPGPSS
jgi:hypothetical protein